ISSRDNHWFADLRKLVQQQLEKNGIQLIYGCDSCTFTEADLFYSYRRDGITGRMASLIWMESLRT
ncbi:MAG: laccase domain-containing protein, partial [Gammaproteobacteria bacterium]